MATPKLKPASAPAASPRLLRPSGAAPAAAPKLKSATGKTITPKKAPAPAKAPAPKAAKPATPAPEVEEVMPTPAPEATPIEEIAAPIEETPAEPTLTPEEEEAARLAQEEYERQMEEYNRQMEEYNRQMAALQAAEGEAAPAEESPAEETAAEDAPAEEAPAEEAPKKKKKKKAPRPTLTEEEMAQVQAALEAEQKAPVWKTVPFMVGAGLLVVTIGICTVLVVQKQAEDARIEAHREYTNTLLRRAQDINMKGVENMADAAKKGVNVTCSMEDAKALMEVVVDPYVKGENGKPRYGARAEGVAMNACLLLGLAAEKDAAIRDMIFDTMGKECTKIKPVLFNWLLQRIAISDAEGVNTSLKKLSKVVADKKTAKPWKDQGKILSHIWECIGLRVTEADVKEIIGLLKTDMADGPLATNLCICLGNVIKMMDDADAKAQLGDEIFTTMPEKLRKNTNMAGILASACSPKALEYYKQELSTAEGWTKQGPNFLGAWGNDDILDYVLELKETYSDDKQIQVCINNIIGTIMKQDRPRTQEQADKLIEMSFKDAFADTSGIKAIVFKTDPASIEYVGDDSPELPALKEKLKELEDLRKQKTILIKVLANMSDHDWVINTLKKYTADPDEEVAYEAERAIEKAHANAVNEAQQREAYKKRKKD
ncbi:MAG: hypothetical protein E7032_04470 [Akkermansiaceae bacterium]|nr:hypothetical protein [Akkermansiaceae bacterium]